MSFDPFVTPLTVTLPRLNPFGTGQCLSTELDNMLDQTVRLNPFGTGQCLSTAVGC